MDDCPGLSVKCETEEFPAKRRAIFLSLISGGGMQKAQQRIMVSYRQIEKGQQREIPQGRQRNLVKNDAKTRKDFRRERMGDDLRHFRRGALPTDGWERYRKMAATFAIYIDEPFSVDTAEGTVSLPKGGWLALDSRGYPYPIAREEFDETYERIESSSPEFVDGEGAI